MAAGIGCPQLTHRPGKSFMFIVYYSPKLPTVMPDAVEARRNRAQHKQRDRQQDAS